MAKSTFSTTLTVPPLTLLIISEKYFSPPIVLSGEEHEVTNNDNKNKVDKPFLIILIPRALVIISLLTRNKYLRFEIIL